MTRFITISIFLLLYNQMAVAQACTTLGQTPSTAFPVCGSSVFQQTTVPICQTQNLFVTGCSNGTNGGYMDKNPFWYKFTCFQSGSLAFVIAPLGANEDYDWNLYDITGHNPNDVFTDNSLLITGNWAGTYGNTGASSSGVNFIQCGSDPADNKNPFAAMPNLIAGHTYLLLVSHFSDTQSGYNLSFGGGTAVITDTTPPKMKVAEAPCHGDVIRLKLKKKIKCNSISGNGSEFFVTPGNINAVNAVGIGCAGGFDTDSLEIRLNGILPPGTFVLNIRNGSDGNTLLDICDNPIPTTDTVHFTVYPIFPTPMDSLVAVKCSPNELKLIFPKSMQCSSIAADGSDFSVIGTYPVNVNAAAGNCGNNLTREITVTLSQPLQVAGNFRIVLKRGTDGNTLLNECGEETAIGSFLPFSVKDTVNADFNFIKRYGCTVDTIYFSHDGRNGVNSWQWNLDENQQSSLQNPTGFYRSFTNKNIQLVVTNGFCSDTSSQTIPLTNFLKADFAVAADNCPNETVKLANLSQGIGLTFNWSFGDGGFSTLDTPAHVYAQPYTTSTYAIRLTVRDSIGCESTAIKTIKIYSSCAIFVPNAFTPNNDGLNDALRPLNAVKAEKLEFKIFNRWGQMVFQTNDWHKGWDGKIKDKLQPSGVYVWFLRYTDVDTKEERTLKGTVTLIR
jgi:gliding motility-associated-like protein